MVRSPHAHARVRRIDAAAALALPGVLAVVTAADIADIQKPWPARMPSPVPGTTVRHGVRHTLPVAKVRHVGEVVAAVVAESRALAEDARDLVEVEYETAARRRHRGGRPRARRPAGLRRAGRQHRGPHRPARRPARAGLRRRRPHAARDVPRDARRQPLDGGPRRRRPLRRGAGRLHRLGRHPDAARHPRHARLSLRPARAPRARDRAAGRGRRPRAQGELLPGGGARLLAGPPPAPPRQVDRGPPRALPVRRPGARADPHRRDRLHQGRHPPRAARRLHPRHRHVRRARLPGHHRLHRARPLSHPEHPLRGPRGLHQPPAHRRRCAAPAARRASS